MRSKFQPIALFVLIAVLYLPARMPVRANAGAPPAAATPIPADCIPIKEAVAKGLVTLQLSTNGNLFFRDLLHYVIVNVGTAPIKVCFPAGQIVQPGDSEDQALVITPSVLILLDPGKTAEGDLFAFCINESKSAPSSGVTYTLGKMAEGSLLKLAQTIEAESAQGHLGAQLAVWAITDKFNMDDLQATPQPGAPSTLTDSIKSLLCLGLDEADLGQKLLQDSGSGAVLYHGENPLKAYCASQGIPSIGDLVQQAKLWGERALILIALGVCGCLAVAVLIIVLIVRAMRGRK